MQNSTFRGHPIEWDDKEQQWIYCDTKKPSGFGEHLRPCVRCERLFQGSNYGDADPCLGNLPGVDNACCGHGDPSTAYIRFTNGVVIEGFTKVTYTPKHDECIEEEIMEPHIGVKKAVM